MPKYWKNFFVLYSMQFMQLLDFMSISPLGALFVRQGSVEPSSISFALTSYSIAAIISSFLIGQRGRSNPKGTLLWLMAIFTLSQLILVLPMTSTLFILAKTVGGFTGGLMGSIAYSQISNIEDGQRTGLWNGRIQTAQSIAVIGGIPLCLLTVNSFGSTSYFIFMSLWSLLTMATLAQAQFMIAPPANSQQIDFKFALKHRDVVITGFVCYVSAFLFIAQLANYLLNFRQLSPEQLSLAYTFSGVLTLISSGTIGQFAEKKPAHLLLIACLPLVCLPQLFFLSDVPAVWLALVILPAYLTLSNARAIYQRGLILTKDKADSFQLHLLNNIAIRTGILTSGVVLGVIATQGDLGALFRNANALSIFLNLALAGYLWCTRHRSGQIT